MSASYDAITAESSLMYPIILKHVSPLHPFLFTSTTYYPISAANTAGVFEFKFNVFSLGV